MEHTGASFIGQVERMKSIEKKEGKNYPFRSIFLVLGFDLGPGLHHTFEAKPHKTILAMCIFGSA